MKNTKYILIYKNEKEYAYLREHDDFIIEGVLKKSKKLIGGSHNDNNYNFLIFENEKENLDGLSIFEGINGYELYDAVIGENFSPVAVSYIEGVVSLSLVYDDKMIEMIDDLIEYSLSSLSKEKLVLFDELTGSNYSKSPKSSKKLKKKKNNK